MDKTHEPSRAAPPQAARPAAVSQLKTMAAALGDALFRRLTTEEHQIAACILAGDTYADAARYVGVSPSAARRTVQRIVARLSAEAPLRVLVADDHPAHRIMLTAVFESLGCRVRTVTSGAAAVALAGDFDVICLDRNMPGMSGDDAARRIGGRAFLIACTSEPEKALAPFDAIVAKPIQWDELVRVLRSARKETERRRGSKAA